MEQNTRSRGWVFTINNYSNGKSGEAYPGKHLAVLLDQMDYQYTIWGFETGGKEKTPHIQGYMYFSEAVWYNSLRAKIDCFWQPQSRFSTVMDNQKYCSKQDNWYEFGVPPAQGKVAMDRIHDAMKDPSSDPYIFQQFRKIYPDMVKSKDPLRDKKFLITPVGNKFLIARSLQSTGKVWICDHYLAYDGWQNEEVVIYNFNAHKDDMENWKQGFPPKFSFGYETKTFDPDIIVILFADTKERNILLQKFTCEEWKLPKADKSMIMITDGDLQNDSNNKI